MPKVPEAQTILKDEQVLLGLHKFLSQIEVNNYFL